MFQIKGKLIGLAQVAEKVTADYTKPAHQKLQILVSKIDGTFELMDITDKDSVVKADQVGRDYQCEIKVYSPSNIYYTLA